MSMIHPKCPKCDAELLWGSSMKKKGRLTYYCGKCDYVSPIHAHPKYVYVLLPKKPKPAETLHYWERHGRFAT